MEPALNIENLREFWNREVCGERYAMGDDLKAQLDAQAQVRYELEPYLHGFARFGDGRGKRVLEIGVGMGADHGEWARSSPSYLAGVDLAPRAIEFTRARLQAEGRESDLRVANAELLPFESDSFDLVYSWGVLHHSPNPTKAIREAIRVLRPGGTARIMLYHKWGYVFWMLWARYALMSGKPFRSFNDVIAEHLESSGTHAYSVDEARALFAECTSVSVRVALNHGDLMEGDIGARHRGPLLSLAKRFWPRWLVRRGPTRLGSYLFIDATK